MLAQVNKTKTENQPIKEFTVKKLIRNKKNNLDLSLFLQSCV